MPSLREYTDRELKEELDRREEERANIDKWKVYERRRSDGSIYNISRHGETSYIDAMAQVNLANQSMRGGLWQHFCLPADVTIQGRNVKYV